MYAAQRKVLAMLHGHQITVDEAEELLDVMEPRQGAAIPSIPKVQLVGEGEWARGFRKTLDQIAATESPAVIQGEAGTGKELIARTLHYNSRRADKPFVTFHPPSTSTSLVDSEIFGHETGVLTGPTSRKQGLIEIANTGTLFIDEVDKISPETQLNLYKFLENGYFTRVGGTRPIYSDIRIMGATEGDLKKYVDEGKFRSDLYYRLSVCMVQSAPLRERREDLPSLAKHFIEEHAKRDGKKPPKISEAAMKILHDYNWPENARELMHTMEKAAVLCEGDEITPEHLPPLKVR